MEIYSFLTWYYYPPELAFLKEYILRNTRQYQMYKVIVQQFGAVVWPLYLGFRDHSSGLKSVYLSGLLDASDRNPILTCLNTSGVYENVQRGVITNRKQSSGNWGAAVSLDRTSCFSLRVRTCQAVPHGRRHDWWQLWDHDSRGEGEQRTLPLKKSRDGIVLANSGPCSQNLEMGLGRWWLRVIRTGT